MESYYVSSLNEAGLPILTGYVRARNTNLALTAFREKYKLPKERCFPYKMGKRTTCYKTNYSWFTVLCVTPTKKELADALYQITKSYTAGTCYDPANPYSKPHVKSQHFECILYVGLAIRVCRFVAGAISVRFG